MAKTKTNEKEKDAHRLVKLGMSVRNFGVAPNSFDEKTRSVEGVLSTENPVSTWDWKRYEMVDEVLLSDSFSYPSQIPLLDSHNRFSVKDQLGSVRDMRTENNQLVGRFYFATTSDAEDAMKKVREGHLTDLSIGYIPNHKYIAEGETYQHSDGRKFTGPLNLSTITEVKECSLTPIGADSFSKLRSAENSDNVDKYNLLIEENRKLKEVIKLVTLK